MCCSHQGLPYRSALKVLAQRFLKRRIQEGSHDSVIDARAALDLVNLKIKHGVEHGVEHARTHGVMKSAVCGWRSVGGRSSV